MDTYDVLKFLENKLLRLRNQIVNKITQKLRLHSTAAVNPESDNSLVIIPTFKVDVESVLRSHGYTFTVSSAIDWQLYQWCRDQSGAIPQSFFHMVDVTYGSGSGRLALAKCPRSCKFIHYSFRTISFSTLSTLIKTLSSSDNILFINTAWNHAWHKCHASAG